MNIVKYVDSEVWWIITANGHFGYLEYGQQVTSIHDFETFLNRGRMVRKIGGIGTFE